MASSKDRRGVKGGRLYGESIHITGDWNVVQDFLLTDAHEADVDTAVGANYYKLRALLRKGR